MKAYINNVFRGIVALAFIVVGVTTRAEESPIYEEPAGSVRSDVPAFTQAELDQMMAPIALYPDSLLSQMLMASTYPLEIVQAARWSRANPGLRGEQAVRAVEDMDWDPSVKSMVAFPQILTMMDEKIQWTERLGDAYLAQPSQVMDTVQGLRQRAYAAGNLQSNDNYRVVQQQRTIVIESPYPQVVYVPYYDPFVVYGTWWWPAYRPVHWAPWHGYYVRAGYGTGFRWSVGIAIGSGFFFGACDWDRRYIRVVDARPFYYKSVEYRPVKVVNVWYHEPRHRRGVPYRHATVHAQYHRTAASVQVRRDFREPTQAISDRRIVTHDRWESHVVKERHDHRGHARHHFDATDARIHTPNVHGSWKEKHQVHERKAAQTVTPMTPVNRPPTAGFVSPHERPAMIPERRIGHEVRQHNAHGNPHARSNDQNNWQPHGHNNGRQHGGWHNGKEKH